MGNGKLLIIPPVKPRLPVALQGDSRVLGIDRQLSMPAAQTVQAGM